MSAESENFRELRRLVALKRYEQAPPGYFNDFSRKVIARIEAGEGSRDSFVEVLFGRDSWLSRLWSSFGTKPILAGAFGITVCSVLIAGVAYSDRGGSGGQPPLSASNTEQRGLVQVGGVYNGGVQPAPVMGLPAAGGTISTEERTSLFQDVPRVRPQLINAVTPGVGN